MSTQHTLDLKVPKQCRTSLTFADKTADAIETWLTDLPKANLGVMAKQLYLALQEVNQLQISHTQRFDIMELFRPQCYYVCDQLGKHFLGHSIVLTEQQRKIANLAQTIQYQLTIGYKHIVRDMLLGSKKPEGNKDLLVKTIHRAMSDTSHTLLRAYQLYCPIPKNLWHELHQLYRLAESLQLLQQVVNDPQNSFIHDFSIEANYKRMLLLACSRPNQVRQGDLLQIFNALEYWTDVVILGPARDNVPTTFIIDLESDAGPTYRALFSKTLKTHHRTLESTELTETLNLFLKDPDECELTIPKAISKELLLHLAHAWGPLQKRSFKRIPATGTLELSVGLTATHYYLCGKQEFRLWLEVQHVADHIPEHQKERFQKKEYDVWSPAFDARHNEQRMLAEDEVNITYTPEEEKNHKPIFPVFSANLLNTSPGGYCVSWQGHLPQHLQTGELLGIHEVEYNSWNLAIIRWLHLEGESQVELGIELLTCNARPCAMCLIRKIEDSSQYMRGFFVPEIKALDQPASLITPRIPFQVGHKIKVNLDGVIHKAQLTNLLLSTPSFNQFEFHLTDPGSSIKRPGTNKPKTKDDDDEFGGIWDIL